jgi:hypothetical protein
MGQTALKIRPYFSAHIGPPAAKTKILAEVNTGLLINHAIKKSETPGTVFKCIVRPVFTAVF